MLDLELNKLGKQHTGGKSAFHGTSQYNLFSILHGGLRNQNGGVWFSSLASHSMMFIQKGGGTGVLRGPKDNAFKGKTVLFGVEALGQRADVHPRDYVDEAKLAIRYIFVLHRGSTLAEAHKGFRTVMEQTISNIRSSKITKELKSAAKTAQGS